jgi:hypothetical protein
MRSAIASTSMRSGSASACVEPCLQVIGRDVKAAAAWSRSFFSAASRKSGPTWFSNASR